MSKVTLGVAPTRLLKAADVEPAQKPSPDAKTARLDAFAQPVANRSPARAPLLGPPATLHATPTSVVGPAPGVPQMIAAVPVQAATERAFEGLTRARPLMTKTVDVQFGRLDRSQFDALSKAFGGHSKVRHDATREYTAVDFLPPFLQAVVNRDIDAGGPHVLKGTRGLNAAIGNEGGADIEIGANPNCHGTAWEALRAYQGQLGQTAQLFYGDAVLMEGALEESATFEPLASAAAGERPAFLESLKPGDLVVLRKSGFSLLHSAVHVGGGLFFEKPHTESDQSGESPYRLVAWEQLVAPVEDLSGAPPTAHAFRPRVPLPSGVEAFTAEGSAQQVAEWAQRKGRPLTKPLVREYELGIGGAFRGFHLNAVETIHLAFTPEGRGIVG